MNAKRLLGAMAATLFAAAPLLTAAGQSATATPVAEKEKETVHRASTITGMTVKNAADQDLGEVNDIVIDVTSGDVHYLAVSYGGFLGLGDKLFAVPLDAFQLREGDGERYLILPIDEQTLKSAPGFDQDNWPMFADKSWNERINKHYSKYRRTRTDRDRDGADIDVRAGNTGVSVDIDRNRGENRLEDRAIAREKRTELKDTIHPASAITGMTVKNEANKELGQVNDLVIDLDRGRVRYLALSYGGVLGVGDKLFAVPFQAFECRQGDEEDEYYLVVNVDEQKLKNAPGFDQDNWPNFADPRWDDELDRYYELRNRRAQRDQTDQTDL